MQTLTACSVGQDRGTLCREAPSAQGCAVVLASITSLLLRRAGVGRFRVYGLGCFLKGWNRVSTKS